MSNTERPVIEWLRTIADPIVRESAISKCANPNLIVERLAKAIYLFSIWDETREGYKHWNDMWFKASRGELATIATSSTNWM